MATETTRLLHSCVVDIPKHVAVHKEDDDEDWAPLTFEQLLPYVNDPWWKSLRYGLMLSFWITLISMFLAVCIILIMNTNTVCSSSLKDIRTPPLLGATSAQMDLLSYSHNLTQFNAVTNRTILQKISEIF